MPANSKTIAVVNGTGRQAASVIRAVNAIGWNVKAQIYEPHPKVLEDLESRDNVELFEGELIAGDPFLDELFEGCDYAFINTFPAGDEVKLGKALADAAKRQGVQYFIYGSMPDHSVWNNQWPALPNWACKFAVENYIRQLGLPATFLYAGIYNNNFTSLPYPLFCMDFQEDGSVEWRAPFHPNVKLPWLDAESDTGPAVLQLLKDGSSKWRNKRVALAYQTLTPNEVCHAFERALGRKCRYVYDTHIDIRVPIPENYRQQLAGIEILFGKYNAPYFPGPDFESDQQNVRKDSRNGERSAVNQSGHGNPQSRPWKLTSDARQLWPGFRRIEDYFREAFPIEEEANGKDWMLNKSIST